MAGLVFVILLLFKNIDIFLFALFFFFDYMKFYNF